MIVLQTKVNKATPAAEAAAAVRHCGWFNQQAISSESNHVVT
jgi:hypothetical protein